MDCQHSANNLKKNALWAVRMNESLILEPVLILSFEVVLLFVVVFEVLWIINIFKPLWGEIGFCKKILCPMSA